jgi:NAD(P)-dependent dehydrogenase (short-subunit alcohol dehydrogenase family)
MSANEEWAIILGVSEGSGAAIARAVAMEPGLDVFGMHRGRHPESAAEVERAIREAGRRAFFLLGDAGTAEGAKIGAEALFEAIGPGKVRLFVHSIANASVGPLASGGAEQLPAYKIEKTFASMAHSFVYWTQELVARGMLAPGARLVGLTNPVVGSLVHGLGLIAATKAALEVYVRQLAAELGPRGYRVNLVNYGLVDTPAGRAGFPEGQWEGVVERAARVTPARRLCTVEEVGRLVSFLCSDAADWFNGATIDFTGGMTQSLLGHALNEGGHRR